MHHGQAEVATSTPKDEAVDTLCHAVMIRLVPNEIYRAKPLPSWNWGLLNGQGLDQGLDRCLWSLRSAFTVARLR